MDDVIRALVPVLIIALNAQSPYSLLMSNQTSALLSACASYENCFADENAESCCLPCSCDMSVCLLKGNCCPNLQTSNRSEYDQNLKPKIPVMNCITTTVSLTNSRKQLSDNEETMSTSHLGVLMVASCLNGANETRCTHPDVTQLNQSTPVYNMDNGMTYRNIFCVHCSNISTENTTKLLPWKAYVTCSDIKLYKSDDLLFPDTAEKIFTYAATTKDPSCGIDFIPPSGIVVKQDLCFEEVNLINNCPENFTDLSIHEACGQFYMPFVSIQENETFVYRNYFCYMCNNEVKDIHGCPADIRIQIHDNNYLVAELNADKKHYSHILTPWLQSDLTPASYIPSGVKCKGTTTYDPYLVRYNFFFFTTIPYDNLFYLF